MSTRESILQAALNVLENQGGAGFSTRAVCAIANVTAPTLYHHFGSADGLLSAAVAEAFRQFLESKKAAAISDIPETRLRQGWDDYVRFASARPRLYAAMMARLLEGARIDAAEHAQAELVRNIRAVADKGGLAISAAAAADLIWASANSAALLHVLALGRGTTMPDQSTIELIREGALRLALSKTSGPDSPTTSR